MAERVRVVVVTALLFVWVQASYADPFSQFQVTASATPDRLSAKILDPITVVVSVEAPSDVNVVFPELSQTIGPFELISINDIAPVPLLDGDRVVARQWARSIMIQSIKTGEHVFPSLEIGYRVSDTSDAITGVVRTQPISIQIASVLSEVDSQEVTRPLKDTLPVEPTSENLATKTTMGIVGAFSVFVLFWIWLRRRDRHRTPEQWLTAALAKIQSERDQKPTETLSTLSQVATVARDYILLREEGGVKAKTSTEVAEIVRQSSSIPESVRNSLVSILLESDQWKFSGKVVSTDELQTKLDDAVACLKQLSEYATQVRKRVTV